MCKQDVKEILQRKEKRELSRKGSRLTEVVDSNNPASDTADNIYTSYEGNHGLIFKEHTRNSECLLALVGC
jgi:hypothetical protein